MENFISKEEALRVAQREGWDWLCENHKLSEEFIEEWIQELSVKRLLEYQELSREFINSFRNILQYKCLKEQVSYVSADIPAEEVRGFIVEMLNTFSKRCLIDIWFIGEAGEYFFENYLHNLHTFFQHVTFKKKAEGNNAVVFEIENRTDNLKIVYII